MHAKWVVLEVVKQRVCSPLNARGHDKKDLWRQGRGQVRRVGRYWMTQDERLRTEGL